MEKQPTHILLIDDVKFDVEDIKRQLGETMSTPFILTHLSELEISVAQIKDSDPKINIIILDLGLTSHLSPKEIFSTIEKVANKIPIIVITGNEEHELALFVINAGAADNMTRGNFRQTYGKLSDAIEFSLARCTILKESRKNTSESEFLRRQLLSYINGEYSHNKK